MEILTLTVLICHMLGGPGGDRCHEEVIFQDRTVKGDWCYATEDMLEKWKIKSRKYNSSEWKIKKIECHHGYFEMREFL